MVDRLTSLSGLGLLIGGMVAHRRFSRAIDPPPSQPPLPDRFPSVTVIRPVRGRDVGVADNFAAALTTDYPGEVETLFVFDEENDPAIDLARAAVEEHRARGGRGTGQVMVAGPPPPGRTGKLNAMIAGMAVARGELVGFGDSDTRPDRAVLGALVYDLLAHPRAGATFAPVYVPGPARTVGDAGYALLINALYGPTIARSASRGPVPFIMGQLMLFRREALAAIGGLECAEGQLVDDMYLGARLSEAGWENIQIAHRLPIITGNMSFPDFMELVKRWLLVSQRGLPHSFVRPLWVRGAAVWTALLLAVGALLFASPISALLPIGAAVMIGGSLGALHTKFGGAPLGVRLGWCALAIFFFLPPIYFQTMRQSDVRWRGRVYPVTRERRLAPNPRAWVEPS
jgi:ceramide glucosyltransferase